MTRTLRILVADDSDLLRNAIGGLVARIDSCEICGEARDGAEALKKAEELTPDVMLLDLSIPILHGLKVAQLLARDFPAIAVVIMSEQDEFLLKQIAEESRIDHWIAKSALATGLASLLQALAHEKARPITQTAEE